MWVGEFPYPHDDIIIQLFDQWEYLQNYFFQIMIVELLSLHKYLELQ